jgi:23S rRNA A1618 N6-methylase RlmF
MLEIHIFWFIELIVKQESIKSMNKTFDHINKTNVKICGLLRITKEKLFCIRIYE